MARSFKQRGTVVIPLAESPIPMVEVESIDNPAVFSETIAGEGNITGLTVYGKSTQDGTPSPENPVPIVSAGDDGEISITLSDSGEQSQSLTFQTPNSLPGLPVESGGNYVDANGQQWLCNYRDYGRGVDVGGNVNTIIFDGSSGGSFYRTSVGIQTEPVFVFSIPTDIWVTSNIDCLSNQYVPQTVLNSGHILQNGYMWTRSEYFGKAIAVRNDAITSESEMKTFLQSNPLIFVLNGNGNLIETPIPPEELAAYRALHTYDGTTVISVNSDPIAPGVKTTVKVIDPNSGNPQIMQLWLDEEGHPVNINGRGARVGDTPTQQYILQPCSF